MKEFTVNGIPVDDTFCETFSTRIARLLITSVSRKWALESALEAKGLGRSATIPPSEAYLEREVKEDETPDGRPGFIIQIMDRKKDQFKHWFIIRIRKGAIPIPQTRVFNAMPAELADDHIEIKNTIIQTFGDGFEKEVKEFGREMLKIPRMDGWFYVEKKFGFRKTYTGGMFLILADSAEVALESAERALEAMTAIPGVVGKIAASGSKVGGKTYKDAVATTNDAFCPVLTDNEGRKIADEVKCVYELIVTGLTLKDMKKAMKIGIEEATKVQGVQKITASNYGGTLGKGKIFLHELFNP